MSPAMVTLCKHFIRWALPAIGIAYFTGYFTYRKAAVEAEIGYQALHEAVREMQPFVRDLSLKVAYLEGQVDGHTKQSAPARPGYTGNVPVHTSTAPICQSTDAPAPSRPDPTPPSPVFRPRALPSSINDAVQELSR